MKTLRKYQHYVIPVSQKDYFAELLERVVKKDYNILSTDEWFGVFKAKCQRKGLFWRDVLGKGASYKSLSAKELHDLCEGIVKGDFS